MVVEDLKKHPGRWGIVFDGLKKTAGYTHVKRLKAAGCDATIRTVDGEHKVFARWPK